MRCFRSPGGDNSLTPSVRIRIRFVSALIVKHGVPGLTALLRHSSRIQRSVGHLVTPTELQSRRRDSGDIACDAACFPQLLVCAVVFAHAPVLEVATHTSTLTAAAVAAHSEVAVELVGELRCKSEASTLLGLWSSERGSLEEHVFPGISKHLRAVYNAALSALENTGSWEQALASELPSTPSSKDSWCCQVPGPHDPRGDGDRRSGG